MSSEHDISITISGTTHHFKAGDVNAMRDLPWSERKQLIDLLENIKQAEYVKTVKQPESKNDAQFDPAVNPVNQGIVQSAANTTKPQLSASINNPSSASSSPDPAIKASEQDVDDLMARLIMEQKSNNKHQSVPDKSSVIKWLLVIFAIIIVLALIS